MATHPDTQVVVIGAGQAGLATSYHLQRRGIDHIVLDAGERPGQSWTDRWDSLRLFTPARFSQLPGLPLTAADPAAPTTAEMADYLTAYTTRFALPVTMQRRVRSITTGDRGDGFTVTIDQLDNRSDHTLTASAVVWAAGAHTRLARPWAANQLHAQIDQLDALSYRRPSQISAGPVLVVGAGNSGAEIALDIAGHTELSVMLAGRDVGHQPRLSTTNLRVAQLLGPLGVAVARRRRQGRGEPWGRVRADDLTRAGITRVTKLVGVTNGYPRLADGQFVQPRTAIWCTGLKPDTSWLTGLSDQVLSSVGYDGAASAVPGFYAVGLPHRSNLTSHLVGGVGHDARRTVDHLITHTLYS